MSVIIKINLLFYLIKSATIPSCTIQ